MSRPGPVVALLIAATLLVACERHDTGYFPLHAGASWTYRITDTTQLGERTRGVLRIRNVGTAELDGVEHHVRRTSDGVEYYIRRDERGTYRTAKRSVADRVPIPDDDPRYVLKLPLRPGTQWQSLSHPYAVRRVHPYVERLERSARVRVSYQIAATDARVETPVGAFDRCIRVEGEATFRLYTDPRTGWQEIPLRTTEWYAPGVGLVRLEREETIDLDRVTGVPVFTGGTIVLELVAFEP